jgi:hypothetical protein
MRAACAALVLLTGAAACGRTQPEPTSEGPRAASSVAPPPLTDPRRPPALGAEPPRVPAGSRGPQLAWAAPSRFKEAPNPSPMRKATYTVEHVATDTEDAELAVSVAGGELDLNIVRWQRQFEPDQKGRVPDAKRTPRKVGDLDVIFVEMRGTYLGMQMPGAPATAPKKGTTMLVAVVGIPRDDVLWFFKLTGPTRTVEAAKPDLEALVQTLRVR